MRDILISTTVCVACLILACVSQLIVPSTVTAAPQAQATVVHTKFKAAAPVSKFELDPDNPNPILFAMAPEADQTGLSTFSEPMDVPDARLLASGLKITELEMGTGEEATSGRTVVVNYKGTLENGKEFDSSYGRGPFSFLLGAGRVIRGWEEGVAGMKVGGKRKLVIPPDLAYGDRGAGGGVIPPKATLVFEVELLDVRK
ncbi:FKBP-type peptidyl-prolyl cis-trans isomerase [Synechococcus sp. M16CYN]|uniref:FKBP-type peptidyl-prolyl cis-trans isomerase n=1 Tax=Synechococcus sp. M16CYN TaxID=3103139 RepID=UPI003255F0E8